MSKTDFETHFYEAMEMYRCRPTSKWPDSRLPFMLFFCTLSESSTEIKVFTKPTNYCDKMSPGFVLLSIKASTWSEWALMWNTSCSLSMETWVKQSAEEPVCAKSCLIWRYEVARDSRKSVTVHPLAVFDGHSGMTCLLSLEFFTLSQTEYVLSNLIPKSPWNFISEIEYNDKITMQQPAVLDMSLMPQTPCALYVTLMCSWSCGRPVPHRLTPVLSTQ